MSITMPVRTLRVKRPKRPMLPEGGIFVIRDVYVSTFKTGAKCTERGDLYIRTDRGDTEILNVTTGEWWPKCYGLSSWAMGHPRMERLK